MNPREQGSALILASFILLLLTGMGLALVALSRNEIKMNQGDLRAKRAFYIAEAGLEVGRLSLFSTEDGNWTDNLQAVAGVNNSIDFDPALIEGAIVDNLGVVSGLQFSSAVDDVPLHAPDFLASADPPGWYMAYLTNDPLETTQATTDANDRILLRVIQPARAVTRICQG